MNTTKTKSSKTASLMLAGVMAIGGLSAVPASADTPTPTSAVQTVDSEVDANWRLLQVRGATNIRSGPSTGHSIVGALPKAGQRITAHWVRGTRGDNWWRLSGGRGYISAIMLRAVDNRPAPKQRTFYSAASNSANVRVGPGLQYKVVDGIKRGHKVSGTVHGSTGFIRIGQGRYVSRSILSTSPVNAKPAPKPKPPKNALRAEAEKWADRVTGGVHVNWSNDRWRYGWSYPQWWVAKERGIYINESKIRAEQGNGRRAVDVGRATAVHEAIHYLQAREYSDATLAPVAGRSGVPGYEVQADCATHVVGWLYGVSMPTFYLKSCTDTEYDQARKLLRAQGVL